MSYFNTAIEFGSSTIKGPYGLFPAIPFTFIAGAGAHHIGRDLSKLTCLSEEHLTYTTRLVIQSGIAYAANDWIGSTSKAAMMGVTVLMEACITTSYHNQRRNESITVARGIPIVEGVIGGVIAAAVGHNIQGSFVGTLLGGSVANVFTYVRLRD